MATFFTSLLGMVGGNPWITLIVMVIGGILWFVIGKKLKQARKDKFDQATQDQAALDRANAIRKQNQQDAQSKKDQAAADDFLSPPGAGLPN